MIIYPVMGLRNGKCVTLHQGRLDEPSIYHVDPLQTAKSWAAAGAEWIQITDLDAVAGTGDNTELIEKIIRMVPASIQLAGGFRARESVQHWIEQGAGHIVLGTLAARDPGTVKLLARAYPDQIVLALDVWQNRLMADGWKNPVAISPDVFLDSFADDPLAAVLITDIDSEIEDSDAQLGMVAGLAAHTRHPVIVGGIVRVTDDIARLKYVPNIAGAIVGRALFSKSVDLGEALRIAQPTPERVAEFL